MSLAEILAGALILSLTFYALLGGADYGAGIWHLMSYGPHGQAHQQLIARAIAPIWEANHVWLILVVTILFTAFPPAFALITTTLHIPLSVMLIGIVLRGSAFAFRSYKPAGSSLAPKWERVFALSSIMTPLVLGMALGAIASGTLEIVPHSFYRTFVSPWLSAFPIAVGLFAVVLFMFLSAVYLILEAEDDRIQKDFRRRAFITGITANALALVVFGLSRYGAPAVWDGLTDSWWSIPLLGVTGCAGLGALLSLWTGNFYLARSCAAGEVALIVWGWAFAQYPYLVEPAWTIHDAAAATATLRLVLMALAIGAAVLFPSLYYLYRVFKPRAVFGTEA